MTITSELVIVVLLLLTGGFGPIPNVKPSIRSVGCGTVRVVTFGQKRCQAKAAPPQKVGVR